MAVHYGLPFDESDELQRQFINLDKLEGERLKTYEHFKVYQARMSRAYDKLVKERMFHKGDLVMVKQKDVMTRRSKKKFLSN